MALTNGAKQAGYELTGRTANEIVIHTHHHLGQREERYRVHAEFPFDSTRKRMSLIVETPDHSYVLMCKGADSIILPRCLFNTPELKQIEQQTIDNLYSFAVEGLRTLVMGKRLVSP